MPISLQKVGEDFAYLLFPMFGNSNLLANMAFYLLLCAGPAIQKNWPYSSFFARSNLKQHAKCRVQQGVNDETIEDENCDSSFGGTND
ncbi:hypothetical protein OAG1_37570 [Agarivorans sp. OAG1]|nr:hypothetical protein OAG1_37570 [Agarivorans sp. OAG1]